MKLKVFFAVVTGVMALMAAPALGAGKPETIPPTGKGQPNNGPEYTPADPTPGPKAGLPEKARAYGRLCKGTSRKHVKGEKGTEFSRCVTAMAKVANNEWMNPRKACQGLSKKHVKGEKGTEFSNCVKAAAKLKRQQREEEEAEQTEGV
jgi:hypothetical protein